MFYYDALVSINGELMKGRIEIHKGNYVYDPKLYEKYYHIFNKAKFKYLGNVDELIDSDLHKCKVCIYVSDNAVDLVVNNELIERIEYEQDERNA